MKDIRKYEYNCIDNSVLTPGFRKHVAAPVLNWVPKSINPNLITVVSSLFSLFALFIAYRYGQGLVTNLVIAIMIFMYLLSDHLDGMQAKRRGGGTALGEFLDHFLDVLNNGIFLLILMFIFRIRTDFVLLAMFSLGYLAQAAVFFEQYKTGWIVFGKYESFEAVVALIVTIALTGITPVYEFLVLPTDSGLMVVEWLFLITSISGSLILKDITKRVGRDIVELGGFVVSVLMVCAACYLMKISDAMFLVVSISAVLIIQEYMIARLTYKRSRWIDYAPVFFLGGSYLVGNWELFYVLISGLILLRFIHTVYVLSRPSTN